MVFSYLGVPSTLGNPQGVYTATKTHREPTVCGLSQTAAFLLAELAGALLSQSFKNKDKSTEQRPRLRADVSKF